MSRLAEEAQAARERAYAPYSGYTVGAAIEDESGRVHAGCNVENVSFGATMCAERGALSRMVAEGGRRIRRIAVATVDGGTPCGLCLQSLLEFVDDPFDVGVELFAGHEPSHSYRLAELMPHAFASKNVVRPADRP